MEKKESFRHLVITAVCQSVETLTAHTTVSCDSGFIMRGWLYVQGLLKKKINNNNKTTLKTWDTS
jgi:hypothetical protein